MQNRLPSLWHPLRLALALALVAWAPLLTACDDKDPDPGDPVTWCADIEPIVTTVCTACHSATLTGTDRNGAPPDINFDTYTDTLDNLTRANSNIQAGTMPPTGGGLDPADRDLFQQWINQSTPECGP